MATQETQREVRAEAKYVHASAQKARLVADAIRGRSVPEARTILAFTTKAVARDMEKVLRSAVANAEANHGLLGDELVVSAVYADEGPTLKRHRPRARGRVGRIFKRTCHITIKLVQGEPVQARKPKQAAVPEATETTPPAAEAAEKPKRTRKKKEAVA